MTSDETADRIAKQKGLSKMSAQDVGGAVGHHSISLIIPCHRVVGTNGSLRVAVCTCQYMMIGAKIRQWRL